MGFSEPQYQRNLINGLWPPAPSQMYARKFRVADESAGFIPIPKELEELHKKYMYLYELYPGKTWVLDPHPVQVKEGLQANIFKRPNGDYLVPLMAPSHTLKNGSFLKDVEVIVRASDLGKIKGVYARTPDAECRQFTLPWKFENNEIKVTLPWIGSACLLWLSREKQASDSLPPPPRVKGITEKAPSTPVFYIGIAMKGVVPTGNMDDVSNGLKTTAPLPPIPKRKVFFNGHEIGLLSSRNYRGWHYIDVGAFGGIGKHYNSIIGSLKKNNELLIEPDGPQDFFKIKNIQMTMLYADGRIQKSALVANTYSSCQHSLAEGIIGAPIRIGIEFPEDKTI